MAVNATELFQEMHSSVMRSGFKRVVTGGLSPTKGLTLEASPGSSFVLRTPEYNVVGCKSIDLRWAVANTLHFFTGSQSAGVLRKYNAHADKYLTGDALYGAYGYGAMGGVRQCVALLKRDPSTRRAVVALSGYNPAFEDINRPPCWNLLHFLNGRDGLDLLVYQRSLNLFGVMPYDLVLLSNVLLFAAGEVGAPAGSLRWTVGSLHCREGDRTDGDRARNVSLVVPSDVLKDPSACWAWLEAPAESGTCLKFLLGESRT